jgi:hypothetical protein
VQGSLVGKLGGASVGISASRWLSNVFEEVIKPEKFVFIGNAASWLLIKRGLPSGCTQSLETMTLSLPRPSWRYRRLILCQQMLRGDPRSTAPGLELSMDTVEILVNA